MDSKDKEMLAILILIIGLPAIFVFALGIALIAIAKIAQFVGVF